ncbi:hypothetical protein Btru_058947 [Bulinus truncatus]|nr:hypothetical protein Btru_058947 [Bulinus truncatus]
MDSFVDDLERMRMKRKFKDSFNEEDSQVYFGKTRHNLLEDFEATPTKPLRESGSRSFLNYVSPSTDSILLKKEIGMKEAEIIALKAKITQLENQISQCEVASRQAKIEHEKEISKLKTEKDRDGIKLSEMRSKLLYVMEKEKNAREEVNRLQEDLEKRNLEASKKLLAVQKEKMLAMDQTQQLTANFLQTETDLRNQIFKLMRDITGLQSRLSESEAQLSLRKMTQGENEELHKEIEELKKSLTVEQHKNKELEKQFSEQEDNILITKALKNDLDMVPKMKAELEKLRMDNEQLRQNEQNTLLLEEEIRSLKSRLDYASSFQEKITAMEIENEELQGRLQRWEAADTSGSRRPMSPSSLSRRVQELEHLSASFVLSQGDLQSELTISHRKLEKAEEEIKKLTLMLSAEEKKAANLMNLDKRLRGKMFLVTKINNPDVRESIDKQSEKILCVHFGLSQTEDYSDEEDDQ